MAIFVAGLVATGWMYQTLPQGFIPEEDQAYVFVINESPPGVSLKYTNAINRQAMEEVMSFGEVEHALSLAGFSFDGQNANKGIFFVKLKPWDQRPGAQKSAYGMLRRLNARFAQNISGAKVFAVNAPPVDGLSNFGGQEIYIQDRQLRGMKPLIDNTQQVLRAVNERPKVGQAFTTFTFDSPILQADIDRNKAKAQNVNIREVLDTFQTYLGGNFVNQFVLDGRLYRVYAQAEGDLRANPKDIERLYVRSQDGRLVQLSNILKVNPLPILPLSPTIMFTQQSNSTLPQHRATALGR